MWEARDAHPTHIRHGSRETVPLSERMFLLLQSPKAPAATISMCACVAFACPKTVVHVASAGFLTCSCCRLHHASSRHRLHTSLCGSTISDSDTCGLCRSGNLFSVNLQQRACSGLSPDSLSSQPAPQIHASLPHSEACARQAQQCGSPKPVQRYAKRRDSRANARTNKQESHCRRFGTVISPASERDIQ